MVDNFSSRDGNGYLINFGGVTDAAGNKYALTPLATVAENGAATPISAGNPLPVADSAVESNTGTIATETTASAAALGTTGDAAYGGSGSSTIVAALKGLYALLTGTLKVTQAGSTGKDWSANKPALPNIGSNFGATGPYANYALIATVPANASRNSIDIENNSGAQIAVLLDDGTAASGTAPANASVFALGGGASAGAQGGSWVSQWEKGRVQIFAPSASAQVSVREN